MFDNESCITLQCDTSMVSDGTLLTQLLQGDIANKSF